MRSIVTVVSVALFAIAITGSAYAAPSSAIQHQAVAKVEKKGKNNCKLCKTN